VKELIAGSRASVMEIIRVTAVMGPRPGIIPMNLPTKQPAKTRTMFSGASMVDGECPHEKQKVHQMTVPLLIKLQDTDKTK
jgi:hypothetical protein